jgi:stage V sporulation protein AC
MTERKMDIMKENQQSKTMQEERKRAYQQHVEQVTPKYNLLWRMCKAFLLGGVICVIGQFLLDQGMNRYGLDKDIAGSWCSMLLVLLSVILTGCNQYHKLVEWGGAGALVPITGFANSVSSAAIEYQKEGQVFGIGCKIFTIAGPVILYGIFTSWVLGLVYWLLTLLEIA